MSRLSFVFVGGAKNSWARPVEKEYCKRLSAWRAKLVEIKPGSGHDAKKQEAKRIRDAVASGYLLIALDEKGKRYPSLDFSSQLCRWLEDSPVAMVIGGAAGLDEDLLASSNSQLSLSPLTLSHDVARVVLLEQCYRAWSIATGHPYHRA